MALKTQASLRWSPSGIPGVALGAALLLTVSAPQAGALQLRHTYAPSRGLIGSKLTYTYRLENDGAADESGTLFTNQLPANALFVSAVVTNGTFTVSNNVFACRPERLLAGETNVIRVVVTPVNAYDLTNTAGWVSAAGEAVCAGSVVPVDSARPGPLLNLGRSYHTSTLLQDGRVLVVGGIARKSLVDLSATKTAEVYTPANARFGFVGEMAAPRSDHTATRLADGTVLVAGGTPEDATDPSGGLLPETAEVFDPVANTFRVVASLRVHRARHTTTLLPNGDVILAGGAGTNTLIERLHAQNGQWTATVAGHLAFPRSKHQACLLPSGQILFGGGTTATNAFAEVFDPAAGTGQLVSTTGSPLPVVAAARGKLLLKGYLPGYVPAAEIYDPEANAFTALPLPPDSYIHTAPTYLVLDNGDLLESGGAWSASVNLFDLRAGTITAAPALAARRCSHTAVPFADGRIFLIGGSINNDGSGDMRSTEFYAFRLDADLDGMDDAWEVANGCDPTRREDAVADADGDGHTNFQEFLAGTDPRNPSNVLRIDPPQRVGNQLLVRFPTVVGKWYRVEASAPADPRSWVVIANNLRGDGQIKTCLIPVEPGAAPRFCRVLLLP